MSETGTRKLQGLADSAGINLEITRLFGIPYLFGKYKHRPGIIIGAIIFFVIISLSGKVVWDFDIVGNTRVSDSVIIETLEKRGCRAGTFISEIDFDQLQNDCLLDEENLAWISVNMDGNLARVEVREKRVLTLENPPKTGQFANIVAAEDGIVEICRVRAGKTTVEAGDVVKKGELLISGVIDVGETGVRYEYADGEVMARVYREIESFVPFDSAKTTPTGRKMSEIQLKIFGKSINLSHRGGIEWDVYGIIKEEEKISLPFGITLPAIICRTEYSEVQSIPVTLSENDAVVQAKNEVSLKLRKMADTLQVLSTEEKITVTDEGAHVILCIYGVTDISANYGFSVSDDTEENEDKPKDEENGNSQR